MMKRVSSNHDAPKHISSIIAYVHYTVQMTPGSLGPLFSNNQQKPNAWLFLLLICLLGAAGAEGCTTHLPTERCHPYL